MKLNRRQFVGAMATGYAGLAAPSAFAAVRVNDRPPLLGQALAALDRHEKQISHRDVIGLVDFGRNSGSPRFQIVDIGNGRIIGTHLVAHGRGSDPGNTGMVQRFSNTPGSNASCPGSFQIGATYYGKHGRSRRLHGLDAENDLAYERAIVIHGAPYVSRGRALSSGRVGRSFGCFTVAQRDIDPVLAHLMPGRLLFAGR